MYFAEEQGLYRCIPFAEFVWQKHAFGSRYANPSVNVTVRQVHSDRVLDASLLRDREETADALVSAERGLSIGVRTADCVPLLLLDSRTHAVGAIHAGWRGTAAQIVRRTIEKLQADFRSDPQDIYAAIGPCIRACCYEVSADVAAQLSRWPASVVQPAASKPHVELAAANRAQLIESGLRPARVFDSELCTSCRLDRFFSFRREPQNTGRMLSAISRIA